MFFLLLQIFGHTHLLSPAVMQSHADVGGPRLMEHGISEIQNLLKNTEFELSFSLLVPSKYAFSHGQKSQVIVGIYGYIIYYYMLWYIIYCYIILYYIPHFSIATGPLVECLCTTRRSRSNLLQPSQFECLVHGARKIPMIAAMPLDSGQEPSKAKAFKRGCPEMDRSQFLWEKEWLIIGYWSFLQFVLNPNN